MRRHGLESVTEWGCGDGNQLALAEWSEYTGYDVSATALLVCRARFNDDPTRVFRHVDDYAGESSDAALSLDVVYHLKEDRSFELYMHRLFQSARRLVIVYSSDTDEEPGTPVAHVRHRKFTDWVSTYRPGWVLIEHIPNRFPYEPGDDRTSISDFFVFEPRSEPQPSPMNGYR
jgi:SAM-dependent methyltransferase